MPRRAGYWQLINAVRDCGLYPGLTSPNYCMSLTYPHGAVFPEHWDSRYRWGEAVLGVSLGAPARLTMHPAERGVGNQKVHVPLPRRSIYIMTGPSRTAWKHSLDQVSVGAAGPLPHWNPLGHRRSFTFRCTKTYEVESLKHALAACGPGRDDVAAALRARIAAQTVAKGPGRNWPEQHDSRRKPGGAKFFNKQELEAAAQRAQVHIADLAPGGLLHAASKFRLKARDALFLPHASVTAATRALYANDPQPDVDSYVPPIRSQLRVPAGYGGEGGGGGEEADDDEAALQRAIAASMAHAAAADDALFGGGGSEDGEENETVQRAIAASSAAAAAEDEELRRALAASLRSANGAGAAAPPGSLKRTYADAWGSKPAAAAACVVDLTATDDNDNVIVL